MASLFRDVIDGFVPAYWWVIDGQFNKGPWCWVEEEMYAYMGGITTSPIGWGRNDIDIHLKDATWKWWQHYYEVVVV